MNQKNVAQAFEDAEGAFTRAQWQHRVPAAAAAFDELRQALAAWQGSGLPATRMAAEIAANRASRACEAAAVRMGGSFNVWSDAAVQCAQLGGCWLDLPSSGGS